MDKCDKCDKDKDVDCFYICDDKKSEKICVYVKDVQLIMDHHDVSLSKALVALKNNNGDVLEALIELMESIEIQDKSIDREKTIRKKMIHLPCSLPSSFNQTIDISCDNRYYCTPCELFRDGANVKDTLEQIESDMICSLK